MGGWLSAVEPVGLAESRDLYDHGHMTTVSKSRFKARALELFRQVERTGEELVITDRGRPVLKIVPFERQPGRALLALRETVLRYEAPTQPVAEDEWEALS
jgi:prevent-host-death family protein